MRLWPWLALWLAAPLTGHAGQLHEALEAGEQGVDFLEGAFTGLYQNALEAGEDTGNFEIDLIGSVVLKKRDTGVVGDTDFVFWAFHVDNLGSLQSTGEMRHKAGLLWDTNDINVDSSVTQFGVFGIRQFWYDDRLELGIGKVFPGMIHTESSYTANNSETFQNKIVSASAVGGYFEAIGLGANLRWWGDQWFVQGGFSDAKAESEFDFSSLTDGVLAQTGEVGWAPRAANGDTAVSLLVFRVDETPSLTRQTGWAVAATHDFNDGAWGVFGRYTQADGGQGITEADRDSALPLERAAFAGLSWNQPLGRDQDQLGLVGLYGKPTKERREKGFSNQYGVEAFWRFALSRLVNVTPSLQLLRNQEDNVEVVAGIRFKIAENFARYSP